MPSHFKVTKQYGTGPVSDLAESFPTLKEAEVFVNSKLSVDVGMGIKSTYRIYNLDELKKELNTENFVPNNSEEAQTTGSQGKGSAASFRPNPFATTPKPAGFSNNWRQEDEDKDKK